MKIDSACEAWRVVLSSGLYRIFLPTVGICGLWSRDERRGGSREETRPETRCERVALLSWNGDGLWYRGYRCGENVWFPVHLRPAGGYGDPLSEIDGVRLREVDDAPQSAGDDSSMTCDVCESDLGSSCDVLRMGLAIYDPAHSMPCLLAAGRTTDALPVPRHQTSNKGLGDRSMSRLESQAWVAAKVPRLSGLSTCSWAAEIGVGGERRSHCDNLRHPGPRVSSLPSSVYSRDGKDKN